jgi:predicted chitinase
MLKNFLTSYPFGKLTEQKHKAIEFVLHKLEQSSIQQQKQQAYILATLFIETAQTYEPVIEGYWLKPNRVQKLFNYYTVHNSKALATIFPNGVNGTNYVGRGFVQITHDFNYKTFGDKLNIDLLHNPDKALEPEIAWNIAELGMTKGLFTGKKLDDYFNEEETDWLHARRIINGLDRHIEISEIAQKIYHCIAQ